MSLTLGRVLSVNVAAAPSPTGQKESGLTGFGKAPTDAPIPVRAPGPKGAGGSGLVGDTVHDLRHHGGDDQAVYAYAREDLDWWERDLGRTLPAGSFGENLTTHGLDLTGARLPHLRLFDSRADDCRFAGAMMPDELAGGLMKTKPSGYSDC